MKDNEILKMIEYIADQKRYINIQELCNHFKISRRTIFYRIKRANQLLKSKGLPLIKNVPKRGYFLSSKAAQMGKWGGYKALLCLSE
ncbi:HTH domain-containing protein [uncultured Lactobacillus sp.]|uniref:HTH domain-containing protein n=1 Tax=uncultured Lactobacillus sp. TaxID=153152 RepID=UPI00260F19ED|nr:HTH domain-containing protein [uncultured Lactobacillus sp.]